MKKNVPRVRDPSASRTPALESMSPFPCRLLSSMPPLLLVVTSRSVGVRGTFVGVHRDDPRRGVL
jgi:hypothetical protein